MGGRRKDGAGGGPRGGGVCDVLTPLQEAFCQHYIVCSSGTQAVIKAGYSPNGADVQSSALLDNPRVVARIASLRDRAAAPVVRALTRRILSVAETQELLSRHAESPTALTQAAVSAATLLLKTIPGAIAPVETRVSGDINLILSYDGGRRPASATERPVDAIEGQVVKEPQTGTTEG